MAHLMYIVTNVIHVSLARNIIVFFIIDIEAFLYVMVGLKVWGCYSICFFTVLHLLSIINLSSKLYCVHKFMMKHQQP